MFIYIEIADVVGNAFMELLSKSNRRDLYYYELDAYGAKAVEVLNRDSETNAVYIVSQESQHDICVNYSDLFVEFEGNDGAMGIKLLDGVSDIQIWTRFCAALSVKVLAAFSADEVVAKLG